MILEKFPIIIAIIARRGLSSFLTKQSRMSFKINAGENKSSHRRYVVVISKTILSAPKSKASLSPNKSPINTNIAENKMPK